MLFDKWKEVDQFIYKKKERETNPLDKLQEILGFQENQGEFLAPALLSIKAFLESINAKNPLLSLCSSL